MIRNSPQDVRIANAMEPVFSQTLFLRYLLINRIRLDIVRQSMMKDGIEAGNVLDLGELLETDLQQGYRRGIVSATKNYKIINPKYKKMRANLQRRKVFQLFDFVVGVLVDEVISRIVPAMDNSMTCIGNVVFALNLLQVLVIDEAFKDILERIVVRLDIGQLIFGAISPPRVLFFGRGVCEARNLRCGDFL
jgi:hypothetical protein